jgi:hypothetical protein
VRDTKEDSRFKGNKHYRFEAELDSKGTSTRSEVELNENGEQLFGWEVSTSVSFQIEQTSDISCIHRFIKNLVDTFYYRVTCTYAHM